MIRIESITIQEFRGIKHLMLDLKGKNFSVCGPNGTGKSGVVDAIEFILRGNISRLSGEGRGEVSLKQHAPHVDARDNPDRARVKATILIPCLGKVVTLERSVKTSSVATVTPSEPEAIKVLKAISEHPEVVLSRRELIRYVLATPGKRAEEIQALLHLDRIEQVRGCLQKIANSCERQLAPLAVAVTTARDNLLRALEMGELTAERVLATANKHRGILGLPPLTQLTQTTSLKDGMATPKPSQPQRIPKTQALADIKATRELFAEVAETNTTTLLIEMKEALTELARDPAVISAAKQKKFYLSGLELTNSGVCPFCDDQWDEGDLKEHVQSKIRHLKEISRKLAAAEKKLAPLVLLLQKLQAGVDVLLRHSVIAKPPPSTQALQVYRTKCETWSETLTALFPLANSAAVLTNVASTPASVLHDIDKFEAVVTALPEPSKQDAAREWLTIAQERLEVWRDAMRRQKSAREQAVRTRQISDIYATTSDSVLTGIYSLVETDFAGLYGFIHREDEDKFKAKLIPSMGKLGFDVDFYGRGFFPPGAYHSEGHQDCMGLCLYLALMRHLNGSAFTFAVLDDVMMSVDAGHRREVCALLKQEFPNTQFVVTTHDPIWLRHMRTEGLLGPRAAVQFRTWSVDQGPTCWDDRDVWTEIDDRLKQNDVRAAAALLRHYLEYISSELCHRLRARVEFRGDARYQLGELLPAAVARLRKLYNTAKDAASSWNQKEFVQQINDKATSFGKVAIASNIEQWQLNVAVHFNSWDTLGKSDFAPLVKAFRELLFHFSCPVCNEYLRVTPDREAPESLRCDCGKVNINLQKKGI